jgi:hypothetical protein
MRIADAIRERCMNLNLGNCDDSKLIERDPEATLNFPCTQRPDSRNPNYMTIFTKSSLD